MYKTDIRDPEKERIAAAGEGSAIPLKVNHQRRGLLLVSDLLSLFVDADFTRASIGVKPVDSMASNFF